MSLHETEVLDRVTFYGDLQRPSDSTPLLLASPDSEGEVRTGIEVPAQTEIAQIDRIIAKTMLLFGAVELAKQLAHLAEIAWRNCPKPTIQWTSSYCKLGV